jgi:Tfp pilus assembly protein PilV
MNRVRNQRGITLVETLAALGIFSVVAVGFTTSTVANIKVNNESRTIAAATALVQNQIEKIRMIQPATTSVPADLTTGTHSDPNNPVTALGAANGTFTRTWTVSGVSQYSGTTVVGVRPGLVQVAVTVSWTQPIAGSVTAVTYACKTQSCGSCTSSVCS